MFACLNPKRTDLAEVFSVHPCVLPTFPVHGASAVVGADGLNAEDNNRFCNK